MKRWGIFIVVLLGIVLAGCSSDNSTQPKEEAPDLNAIFPVVQTPPATNAPPKAQYWVESFTIFSQLANQYFNQFSGLEGTYENGKWKWTLTSYGITYSYYVEATDTSYIWYLVLDGTSTIPGDTTSFQNWKAIEGYTSLDGKSGSLKAYWPNSTILAWEWVWEINANNDYFATFYVYDEGGAPLEKAELTIYADGSGELNGYEYLNGQWTLVGSFSWDAAGNWSTNPNA
jgi:hypothetical protein